MSQNSKKDWWQQLTKESQGWGHVIYKVTGNPINRRSYVIWSCTHHSNEGTGSFKENDARLQDLLKKKRLNLLEIQDLISVYPGMSFYASRMDQYLKETDPRTVCCKAKLHASRKLNGFNIFTDLLKARGAHYKTVYTLQIKAADYCGKLLKYSIKWESHGLLFEYSMQNLNFTTSCPCSQCRIDPNHRNIAVNIIKKRNAGRLGQVIRHASDVKKKYNFTCALSNSSFDLQHHHLDGQDFYTETQLIWQHNGICICATIHRDYHYNFLVNHSVIAKVYSIHLCSNSDFLASESSNPDISFSGAEVSRYTFLEYLKYLIFDIKYNQSKYVDALNEKIAFDFKKGFANSSTENFGRFSKITLDQLEVATKKFCAEYKSKN
jgi:hypothetical protein